MRSNRRSATPTVCRCSKTSAYGMSGRPEKEAGRNDFRLQMRDGRFRLPDGKPRSSDPSEAIHLNSAIPGIVLLYFWILFNLFALAMLVIDLRVFHRPGHAIGFREAVGWSLMYIAQAAAFAAILYFWQGRQSTLEFVTGYVVELSLSVDNLFVFLMIFNYFAVPDEQQHRVLFWGILGALILRGIFIGAGVQLIHRFHWLLYLFGALLIYSGIRVCVSGEHQVDPASNPVVKILRKWIPVTTEYRGGRFFVRNPQE